MPLLCWHYTPSLWPWSLWTLSRTVSITTTRRRLLVTCVGGFACTEWELHNTEQRKSLWQRSAVWNENQFHEFSNGIILEHVVEDGEVAVFLFFFYRPASVILAHYIIAVDLSLQPQPWDSQLCLRIAVGQWEKQKQVRLTFYPVEGIMAPSYSP